MSELIFGSICFVGGAVAAVAIPAVFKFASNLFAKAKKARDDFDD